MVYLFESITTVEYIPGVKIKIGNHLMGNYGNGIIGKTSSMMKNHIKP